MTMTMSKTRHLASLLSLSVAALVACDVEPTQLSQSDLETRTLAATQTGKIAVLDFRFDGLAVGTFPDGFGNSANQVQNLDTTDPSSGYPGFVTVYESPPAPRFPPGEISNGLWLLDTRKTPVSMSQNVTMSRRGMSSRTYPKKSYSMDLSKRTSVLGMPSGKDWVLHSCWADATCLRNVVAYWQAQKVLGGYWVPKTEFAEVFINDSYRGLYVIIEKPKIDGNRIALPELSSTSADISGGYLLERRDTTFDNRPGDWASPIESTTTWVMESPNGTKATVAQKDYIKNFMTKLESMFKPGNAAYNPAGYQTVMSENASALFVIMEELAFNLDAYKKSLHVTKYPDSRDGRLRMGPVWDFDMALGNYTAGSFTGPCVPGWYLQIAFDGRGAFPALFEMIKNAPQFRRAIHDRWWNLRGAGTISRGNLDAAIDAFASRIRVARQRDEATWPRLGALPNACFNLPTFDEEVAKLKWFQRARIDFLDSKINSTFLAAF